VNDTTSPQHGLDGVSAPDTLHFLCREGLSLNRTGQNEFYIFSSIDFNFPFQSWKVFPTTPFVCWDWKWSYLVLLFDWTYFNPSWAFLPR